jgi:hypothetical protein
MTKHYELTDSVSGGNIFQQKIFCGFALHLCLQMCVNIADLNQISA